MPLPAFFPSVSTIKTNRSPLDYIQLLSATRAPQFLVSAYDIANSTEDTELNTTLQSAIQQNAIVLLDSGNYESYWMRDSTWTRPDFHRVLRSHDWPVAFSFDCICPEGENPKNCARKIADSCREDRLSDLTAAVLPIIHGSHHDLPVLSASVAGQLFPLAIAVPERELGDGIAARVATVRRIRNELNRLGTYCPLHLLGTGNPWSILLYTVAGADMFDGLEWCQTVVDPTDGRLLHFQQRELLKDEATPSNGGDYDLMTLTHNLRFYGGWMRDLQASVSEGTVADHVREKLPSPNSALAQVILNES